MRKDTLDEQYVKDQLNKNNKLLLTIEDFERLRKLVYAYNNYYRSIHPKHRFPTHISIDLTPLDEKLEESKGKVQKLYKEFIDNWDNTYKLSFDIAAENRWPVTFFDNEDLMMVTHHNNRWEVEYFKISNGNIIDLNYGYNYHTKTDTYSLSSGHAIYPQTKKYKISLKENK